MRNLRRRHGSGIGAKLGAPGKGIGFQRQPRAVAIEDLVFIGKAALDAGNEDFPDAGVGAQPHDVSPAVPVVELADDGNALGIGCPDGEVVAVGAVMVDRVRAHLVKEPEVRTFADVVVVHRAEHRTEAIGIDDDPFAALIAGAVAHRLGFLQRHGPFEEAGVVTPLERSEFLARERFNRHGLGIGDEAAGKDGLAGGVHAEDCEGVFVRARKNGRDIRR
ncbi:hypothetical protein D9M72_511260 [compost metagenome]